MVSKTDNNTASSCHVATVAKHLVTTFTDVSSNYADEIGLIHPSIAIHYDTYPIVMLQIFA
jgi:hypothetical protein